MNRHYNIPIFIPHVGCPFTCIFCNQKKIAAVTSPPKTEDIKQIIEQHLTTIAKNSTVEVAFFGGSFTAIERAWQIKYLQAVKSYLDSGEVGSIRISTRPDFIDENILNLLKEYGVKTIELGVQSLDDGVLQKSGRGYLVADVVRAAQLIKNHHFTLGIQLMLGLPGDNYDLAIKSAQIAISLRPDIARIYPTLVIQDTYLANLYARGLYEPLTLDEAVTISKEIYLQFIGEGIKVIRMGLHPSEELQTGEAIVAGPFHPAFGELVEQEIFYDRAKGLLDQLKGEFSKIIIYVNPRDISKMIGNKRQNIIKLQKEYRLDEIMVKGSKRLKKADIELEQLG